MVLVKSQANYTSTWHVWGGETKTTGTNQLGLNFVGVPYLYHTQQFHNLSKVLCAFVIMVLTLDWTEVGFQLSLIFERKHGSQKVYSVPMTALRSSVKFSIWSVDAMAVHVYHQLSPVIIVHKMCTNILLRTFSVSWNKRTEKNTEKPLPLGSRYLENPNRVFEHNTWRVHIYGWCVN